MVKTEETPMVTIKIVAKICDKCKKEFCSDNWIECQEFHHISFRGGYGSVFGDGASVDCDLCQHCLMELIKSYCRIV